MATSPAAGKICTICGQDCSNKPRTKDPQGRYTCKACLEAAQAKKAAKPAPKAVQPEPDPDAAMMAALLADSPAAAAEQCPACNSGMAAGAVLCTICGYNKQTGRRGAASEGPGVGVAVAGAGAAAAKNLTFLVLSAIGGVIGGAVGAGVWAAVSAGLDREIGWIAVGVGFASGFGAALFSGKKAGPLTGAVAAVIAVCAVMAGKYMAVSIVFDQISQKISTAIKVDDEIAMQAMARQIVKDEAAAGKTVAWPPGKNEENAESPTDYPPGIWEQTEARWNKMSSSEQREYRLDLEHTFRSELKAGMQEGKSAGFFESFSLFDALWFIFAVGAAFGRGSRPVGIGGSSSGGKTKRA